MIALRIIALQFIRRLRYGSKEVTIRTSGNVSLKYNRIGTYLHVNGLEGVEVRVGRRLFQTGGMHGEAKKKVAETVVTAAGGFAGDAPGRTNAAKREPYCPLPKPSHEA